MKVYLLVLDFAMDGTTDTAIEVYASKTAAQEKMRSEFDEYKQEYLDNYEEDSLEIDEPTDTGASIALDGDWNEKHDAWSIVEKEVIE